MKLDVYNTFAMRSDGELMHFDVVLPVGSDLDARTTAMQWLAGIGVTTGEVKLRSCELCHVEEATPEYARQVKNQGYAILQLEGCPSPIY